VFLASGAAIGSKLKPSFFPKDYSYLSYVDVWLPEDAPLAATDRAARKSEEVIRRVAAEYGREHGRKDVLARLTTFVGGGGPRFWFSVGPELQQLNYAQILVQVNDKHDTGALVPRLQKALSAEVPGARIDARQLETAAVGVPVAIRISGNDVAVLRQEAEKLKTILRATPGAERVRDDWGDESAVLRLDIDSDRANFAGLTNYDVATSSASAINGRTVTQLRDGDSLIPVVVRLRPEERAKLSDVQNLYVASENGTTRVPLGQVSKIAYGMETEKLRRRNQFRTITVSAYPADGVLPSEVMGAAGKRSATRRSAACSLTLLLGKSPRTVAPTVISTGRRRTMPASSSASRSGSPSACISSMKSNSTMTWLTITPIRLATPRKAMKPNGAPTMYSETSAPTMPYGIAA